jgi:hypothetical protein
MHALVAWGGPWHHNRLGFAMLGGQVAEARGLTHLFVKHIHLTLIHLQLRLVAYLKLEHLVDVERVCTKQLNVVEVTLELAVRLTLHRLDLSSLFAQTCPVELFDGGLKCLCWGPVDSLGLLTHLDLKIQEPCIGVVINYVLRHSLLDLLFSKLFLRKLSL